MRRWKSRAYRVAMVVFPSPGAASMTTDPRSRSASRRLDAITWSNPWNAADSWWVLTVGRFAFHTIRSLGVVLQLLLSTGRPSLRGSAARAARRAAVFTNVSQPAFEASWNRPGPFACSHRAHRFTTPSGSLACRSVMGSGSFVEHLKPVGVGMLGVVAG